MAKKIITALVIAHSLDHAKHLIDRYDLPSQVTGLIEPIQWDHLTMRCHDTVPTTYIVIVDESELWIKDIESPTINTLQTSLCAIGKHFFKVLTIGAEMDCVIMSGPSGEICLKDSRLLASTYKPQWHPYADEGSVC
jgi:hypothetical protein